MQSVTHVLSTLKLGGAERFVLNLAQVQRQSNIQTNILSLGAQEDFLVKSVKGLNIPIVIEPPGKSRIGRLLHIYHVLKKTDVIHIHSKGALVFISVLFPVLFRKTIVFTRHGLDPMRSIHIKILLQLVRPFISHITFVTSAGKDVFESHHSWNKNRLHTITNGVLIPDKSRKTHRVQMQFGSVGRMIPLKGQVHLIDAYSELLKSSNSSKAPPCSIHFFGSGPLEAELRQMASAVAGGSICFHGEEPDIDNIYSQIDVLVVSSETEGLSMVIIEAMARAIPVIATDVGGNPTLVHDGITGFLVPFSDSTSIYLKMKHFMEHPSSIMEMGKNARDQINKSFSIQDSHEKYRKCYNIH